MKEATMWYLLSQKFGLHHPDLRVRLHQTGDAKLVEGNNWGDTYWGVCEGVGQNRLGVLLMALRWTNQHWHFQELEQLMIRPLDKYP